VRAAALRELHEETGVAPDLVTVEAETAGWLRYDLPDDLIGKAGRAASAGRSRNGSSCASTAPTPTSTSPPGIPSSPAGAGSRR
jgi:8-oxo-dGTP pyrophosphatase MutT (NUDIX family)